MRAPTITLAFALLLAACGQQTLGQPCSIKAGNGGNDDCESGLVCTAGGQLGHPGYDVCCPPNAAANAVVGTGSCNRLPAAPSDASVDVAVAPAVPEASTESDADASSTESEGGGEEAAEATTGAGTTGGMNADAADDGSDDATSGD
jgi:hypothetical protein